MKTKVYFRSYLAHFFLERKTCQAEVVEKLETRFMFNTFFCNLAFYEIN
jgi:hypothetical protein